MRNQRFQRFGGKGDVELPTKIQNCLGANVAIKVAVDVSQRKRNINHGRTQFLIKVRTIILQIDNALEILQKRSHYVATSRERGRNFVSFSLTRPRSAHGGVSVIASQDKGSTPACRQYQRTVRIALINPLTPFSSFRRGHPAFRRTNPRPSAP